jgi:hypothetical protein
MLEQHAVWRSWFVLAIVAVALLESWAQTENPNATTVSEEDRVLAIDVLFDPDATMVRRAEAVNAKLREN